MSFTSSNKSEWYCMLELAISRTVHQDPWRSWNLTPNKSTVKPTLFLDGDSVIVKWRITFGENANSVNRWSNVSTLPHGNTFTMCYWRPKYASRADITSGNGSNGTRWCLWPLRRLRLKPLWRSFVRTTFVLDGKGWFIGGGGSVGIGTGFVVWRKWR